MSSPFQQSFMGKNPFKTAKRMTDAVKAADTEFYKDIDPYEAEGNRMEAEQQRKVLPIDDKTSYDYDYDQNPETTAKKKSPLNSSPLNGAYSSGADGMVTVSDAGHFSKLQSDILGSTKQYIEDTKGENQIKKANKRKRRSGGKPSWAKKQLDKLGLGVLTADYNTDSNDDGTSDYDEKTNRMMNRGETNAKGGGQGMGKNMQCQPGYTWDGTKCTK
tara:strand:- start:220 stop:870 length:651 start_codon:yes stop_codon:yes gene_type:complete